MTDRLFNLRQRVGFGGIDIGRGLAQTLGDMYLSIYLTTVAQVSLAAASMLFLVGKIIDALSDVIIGSLVDRTNTRIGRARPWLFGGSVVFAIGLYIMFNIPASMANSGKIGFMWFAYIIYTTGLTMVNIPEGAMMNLLSDKVEDRTILGSIRGIAGIAVQMFIGSAIAPIVVAFGGDNQVLGYSKMALLIAVVMLLFVVIGTAMTKEMAVPVENKEKKAQTNTFRDLKVFFTDKNFLCEMVFCFGNLFCVIGVMSTLAYYCTFVLDNRMDLMGLAMTAGSVIGFVPAMLAPAIAKRLTKSQMAVSSAIIGIVGILLRYLAPTMPVMIVVGAGIYGIGLGLWGVVLQTAQPDVVDELTLKTGHNSAGLIMALFSLACQIGSGVSNSLITTILGIGHFDGSAAVQSESALNAIRFAFGGIPVIGMVLIIIAMAVYDLDGKLPEIQAKLAAMRSAVEGDAIMTKS